MFNYLSFDRGIGVRRSCMRRAVPSTNTNVHKEAFVPCSTSDLALANLALLEPSLLKASANLLLSGNSLMFQNLITSIIADNSVNN